MWTRYVLPKFPRSCKNGSLHLADALLSVANLAVERGGRLVFSRLSFALAAGDILLVSGRNGAGKSTLLRTIAGLLPPFSGDISFGLATEDVRGVETVHYLGYEDALKPSLTVRENLAFWATMLGDRHSAARQTNPEVVESISPRDVRAADPTPRSPSSGIAIEAALAAFGIARLIDLRAGYLSAGQKRRVALARLLLVHRPIWLLDEPLIALDAETQAATADILANHSAAGGAILLASHQALALDVREIDLDDLALTSGSAAWSSSSDLSLSWQTDAE